MNINGKVRIFAVDTTLFFHSDNINNIIEIASIIMTQLSPWFNSNKLTLNADKSSSLFSNPVGKKYKIYPLILFFLDKQLKRTTHIRFLGITLEENLIWSQHNNEVVNKLKRMFHIFYKIRDYFTKESIKTSIILWFTHG